MSFEQIPESIDSLLVAGFKEIVLTGINLGDYRSGKYRFADVLRLINEKYNDVRFRISSIEPNLITEEIIDIISDSNVIAPHLHIPLQSGSDEILKKMRRRYSVEDYLKTIELIKSKMPGCTIGIDVITGFPGETQNLFNDTYTFLDNLSFSYLHVFTFSERTGTPLSEMDKKIHAHEKKRRTSLLRELSEIKFTNFLKSQIGSKQIFLPEIYDEKTSSWKGHTEYYLPVKTEGALDLKNRLLPVLLKKFDNDSVDAELI